MPRPPRIQVDGALYVITSRGLSPEPLFKDADDYQAYLGLLGEYQTRYGFKLFAYCLLPEHIHLCLEPAQGTTISAVMHDLSAGYTRYFNRRYDRSGHLFQARFKAVVAEKPLYLVAITAYLHRHPSWSGLVRESAEYLYSSYRAYLHEPVPDSSPSMESTIREVLDLLASTGIAEEDYGKLVRGLSDIDIQQIRQSLQQKVLGSDEFVQKASQRLAPSGPPPLRAEPAKAATDSPAPIRRRPRFSLVMTALSCAVVVGGLFLVAMVERVASLERAVIALAKENESMFMARYSLSVQNSSTMDWASLEGTQWDIHITPMAAQGAPKEQTDQIEFSQQQITSKAFTAQGYSRTHYRVTFLPSGALLWEAMQANARGDTLWWRGEWQDTKMRGLLTKQTVGKPAESFSFVGLERNRSEI